MTPSSTAQPRNHESTEPKFDGAPDPSSDEVQGSVAAKEQHDAAVAATESSDLTAHQVQSATDWFLSDKQQAPSVLYFDLNVAGAGQAPEWIRYGVRSLTRHEIKSVRDDATDPNTGMVDDMKSNLRVVVLGSYDPNVVEIASSKGLADPGDIVLQKFAHRPGIIEVIANRINRLSGYGVPNGEMIREIDAAGN